MAAQSGLIWNNHNIVVTFTFTLPFIVFVIRKGYEKIWRTIVEKESLDVRFNCDIFKVQWNWSSVKLFIWRNSRI